MIKNKKLPPEQSKDFLEFCRIACPDYSKNIKEAHIVRLGGIISRDNGDLTELLENTKIFKEKYPGGVLNLSEIPEAPKVNPKKIREYKNWTIGVLDKYEIYLSNSPEISVHFYNSIVHNLLKKR